MTRVRRAQERHTHTVPGRVPVVAERHDRTHGVVGVASTIPTYANGVSSSVTNPTPGDTTTIASVGWWAPTYSQVGIPHLHCQCAFPDLGRVVVGETTWQLRLLFAAASTLPNGSLGFAVGAAQTGNPTPVNRDVATYPTYGFVSAFGVAVEDEVLYWAEWPAVQEEVVPAWDTGLSASPQDSYELVFDGTAGAGVVVGTLRNLTADESSTRTFQPEVIPDGVLSFLMSGWWHTTTKPLRVAGPTVVHESLWLTFRPDVDGGGSASAWVDWPPTPLPAAEDGDDLDCGGPAGVAVSLEVDCEGVLR